MKSRVLKMTAGKHHPDCAICATHRDVNIPEHLLERIFSGEAVIFAGAGISTESPRVTPSTFYDSIAAHLQCDGTNMPFPKLMAKMEASIDGRHNLLRILMDRFDKIDSFPELQNSATRFHKELATLHHIKDIITTNWDTYFEDFCGAKPFIADHDLAFWNDCDRRVLKIHGSITSLGSIVASTADYARCEASLEKGILGSILKSILATKTLIFIGYSFRDTDFRSVYDFVQRQMQGLKKQAFVVTPFAAEAEQFSKQGLIPIVTAGEHFIHLVKEKSVELNLSHPDYVYDRARLLRFIVLDEHKEIFKKFNLSEHPHVIYAACYQDGMIHALDRILRKMNTGLYSDPSFSWKSLSTYEDIQKKKLRAKNYSDFAYIEGYLNGIALPLVPPEDAPEPDDLPLYFSYGIKGYTCSREDFCEFFEDIPNLHKSSFKKARKVVDGLAQPSDTEFHHPPWL